MKGKISGKAGHHRNDGLIEHSQEYTDEEEG